ncbi:hypothetical protein ElyMa_002644400 [Elysia marginata]|uniref:Uncharacterized protein n=1 Tax=Elysia marginata TaxID=1093978 RepID=A0AAV4H9P4_9GAST|nr:hypothetical protein ElyMa_002644400 [Elysia marginata]
MSFFFANKIQNQTWRAGTGAGQGQGNPSVTLPRSVLAYLTFDRFVRQARPSPPHQSLSPWRRCQGAGHVAKLTGSAFSQTATKVVSIARLLLARITLSSLPHRGSEARRRYRLRLNNEL